MKLKGQIRTIAVFGLILSVTLLLPALLHAEVPQLMNYQGQLTDDTGTPLDGDYQMVFSIYDVPAGDPALWSEAQTVTVVNGIYNVQIGVSTDLGNPFQADLFEGQRWLGVTVGTDAEMEPRQALTCAPFAMRAEVADTVVDEAVDTVHIMNNAVTGAKIDNGTVEAVDLSDGTALAEIADDDGSGSGLDADYLDGQDIAYFATAAAVTALQDQVAALQAQVNQLTVLLAGVIRSGDDITFSGVNVHIVNGKGTTNATPNGLGNLIVGYNEERGAGDDRTGSHNIAVGMEHNYSSFGGLVAGRHNTISGVFSSVSGGRENTASGQFSSISGGRIHIASGYASSVSGGYQNTASNHNSSVSGGYGNTAGGNSSSVSGGYQNTASELYSSISGGDGNTASGERSSVSGGRYNIASGYYSSVSGGANNTASNYYTSVSGGRQNTASASYSTVSGGQYNTASGSYSIVSGGQNNTASGDYSFIGGGGDIDSSNGNEAWSHYSAILGGRKNTAGNNTFPEFHDLGQHATVSGGDQNTAHSQLSTVSGGQYNTASGSYSIVSGGQNNTASGDYSFIGGGGDIDSSNGNEAWSHYSAILGGVGNFAGDNSVKDHSAGQFATVSGGGYNTASGITSSVSGGFQNTASGVLSSVSAGYVNTASGEESSVSGGRYNGASGDYSSVSGGGSFLQGTGNYATGSYSSISGGQYNTASGDYSGVSGGLNRSVSGSSDWRAGSLFEDN